MERAAAPVQQGTTLSEQVADWLADQIVSGQMKPGQPLLENDLSSRLGTSRAPIREAFRMLEKEGLVRMVPRRHVVVSHLSASDCIDLYSCRQVLEGFCVRLATEVMTAQQIREVDGIFTGMETSFAAGDAATYQQLNEQFHMTLYVRSGNRTAFGLVKQLWRKTLRYRSLLLDNMSQLEFSVQRHRAIMEAIRDRDGERADDELKQLLAGGLATIVSTIRAQSDEPETKPSDAARAHDDSSA